MQASDTKSRGFALITSVMVGAILVIIVATGTVYLLGSSRLETADRNSGSAVNAAHACLSQAIATFDTGNPDAVATESLTFGNAECDVDVGETPDDGYVIESSGYLPNNEGNKKTLRAVIQPDSTDYDDYAVLAGGDVSLQKHAFVASLPSTGQGDVRSNGNVALVKHSSIWGDATAKGDVAADSKSHVWGTTTEGAKTSKIPAYTKHQIAGLADEAKDVKSTQIPSESLSAGNLDGYYYSYAGYDYLVPVDNGATLKLAKGSYTITGTMFVAGKLQVDDHVTITGEGKIVVTEGVLFKKHSKLLGSALDQHSDVISLHGDIEARHHSILGQVAASVKGRKDDDDDDKDSDDEDCKFGLDDALFADKRDADLVGCAAGGGDDGKDDDDKDKEKDKGMDSVSPLRDFLALFLPSVDQFLVAPAYAKDKDDDDDDDDDDKDGKDKKKKSGDQKYKHFWKKKFKGTLPVGCTLFAPSGDIKLSKHVTVIGNLIAGGTVEMHNHSDVIRNSDDPVQSIGLFSWKSTTVQTVK
jgi:type II secretory pathway pseudopilin PulG